MIAVAFRNKNQDLTKHKGKMRENERENER